ncbi:MAG TPA: glycerol-3-phosphate dehydrogenase [Gemmataceae bacterium]|nr:glycerol-3-phosphate dehydrogenase [Gemmataceae bacterium]
MKRAPEALRDGPFDLLILGGGITGAGVALDASLRGFRVALIDKGDFASGTSSVSSKLVHGGLRYLEHAELRLVYEALHERRRLLRNAPHLVHPLRFVLPFYAGARVPPWKWRAGLLLYDLLAGRSNIARSRPLHLGDLRRAFPGLNPRGLVGGAAYFDAQMDDARLCIEVVRTAALQGACVANYVEAVGFEKSAGTISGVRAVDHAGGGEFVLRARQVLNATGPWVDAVCRLAGDPGGPHLKPTKGVHLVVQDLGLSSAFLLLHPADGRVFFVIPWLGKTLIGTTDTEAAEPPDALAVTDADVAYLLQGYNHHFQPPLERRDILGTFVGLRPLIHSAAGTPSAQTREFRVFGSASGLLSVAGGKYTTYRHMAEVITDEVARRLGRPRRCRTRDFRLDGAPRQPWAEFEPAEVAALRRAYGLAEAPARHLVRRYGRRAAMVAAHVGRDPDLGRPIVAGEPDLRAELIYQRDHEMALFPADHLLRRTRLGLFHPNLLTGAGAPGFDRFFGTSAGGRTA